MKKATSVCGANHAPSSRRKRKPLLKPPSAESGPDVFGIAWDQKAPAEPLPSPAHDLGSVQEIVATAAHVGWSSPCKVGTATTVRRMGQLGAFSRSAQPSRRRKSPPGSRPCWRLSIRAAAQIDRLALKSARCSRRATIRSTIAPRNHDCPMAVAVRRSPPAQGRPSRKPGLTALPAAGRC